MTTEQIVLGIVIGIVAGVLSGLFGVGGGIITTPAIQELLGGSPYIAVGTPLQILDSGQQRPGIADQRPARLKEDMLLAPLQCLQQRADIFRRSRGLLFVVADP